MATSCETNEDETPKWILAKEGIKMLINNKDKEAVELFKKYPDSLQMFAGYAFTVFLDALMTFEEDKLSIAMATLKETERKCTSDSGWLKKVSSKMFGSDLNNTLAANLENQIILADSQVCIAILTFLQQDLSGYFKGGWVLRKSWKVYQHAYQEILDLHKQIIGDSSSPNARKVVSMNLSSGTSSDAQATVSAPNVPENSQSSSKIQSKTNGYIIPNKIPHSRSVHFSHVNKHHLNHTIKKSTSVNSALSKHDENQKEKGFMSILSSPFSSNISLSSYFTSNFHIFASNKYTGQEIDKETIERLMAAVSFGYGLFQLGISLLPPSLLRFTNLLGFGGNRQNGMDCLLYARLGTDMRAPLATLSLLWYHTIVRPFYALDGSNVQAGVEAASQLIEESMEEYEESALFLFFRGRVHRLNSDIPKALAAFRASVENTNQREIKILSLHEVGWCYLVQLDYDNAGDTFNTLKLWSRWSRSFYAYLASICAGSCNKFTDTATIKEMTVFYENPPKGLQLEEFLSRRYRICPSTEEMLDEIDTCFWKMLVYELLYLWNTLASCTTGNIDAIIKDCESYKNNAKIEPMVGLSSLIEGSCYCIQKSYARGIEEFRRCLLLRNEISNNAPDTHISAFAQFELALLLIKNDETKEEGKMLLQQMSHYKDYDFEHRLNVRVHMILKHL